jgi:hypothetical protein
MREELKIVKCLKILECKVDEVLGQIMTLNKDELRGLYRSASIGRREKCRGYNVCNSHRGETGRSAYKIFFENGHLDDMKSNKTPKSGVLRSILLFFLAKSIIQCAEMKP